MAEVASGCSPPSHLRPQAEQQAAGTEGPVRWPSGWLAPRALGFVGGGPWTAGRIRQAHGASLEAPT